MAFIKRKSVLITMCVLIGTLVFSAFSLAVVNIFKNHKEQPQTDLRVEAADLTISNFSQLKSFAAEVNAGNSYSGKTIVLSSNINGGGGELPCIGSGYGTNSLSGIKKFEGTFNGQGHTISNYKLTGGVRYTSQTIDGQKKYIYDYYYLMALFVSIGNSAVIKNVKIENYTFGEITHASTSAGHTHYHHDSQYGLVSNYYSYGTLDVCSGGSYNNVASATNIELTNSIVNSRGVKITTEKTTTDLYFSNVGGKYNSSAKDGTQSIWYYAPEYSSWPQLRVFMDWQTINFTTIYTVINIDKPSIQVPSGYSCANKYYQAEITICGQKIKATITDNCFDFSEWVYYPATHTYQAKAIKKVFTATFLYNGNATLVSQSITYTSDKSMEYDCGSSIEITKNLSSVNFYFLGVNIIYEANSGYIIKDVIIKYTTSNTELKFNGNQTFELHDQDVIISLNIVKQTWHTQFN